LGDSRDMAALIIHPDGYTARRIKTDGDLLMVYNDNGDLIADSLIPVAVPGKNIKVVELEEMQGYLRSLQGSDWRFIVRGKSYTGTILEGKKYCAAWTEGQQGIYFETENSKNPNGKLIERL